MTQEPKPESLTHNNEFVPSITMHLRGYQAKNIEFLLREKRRILGDDPGLGKTRSILETIVEARRLKEIPEHSLTLVVCPRIAFGVWDGEIDRWIGSRRTLDVGNERQSSDVSRSEASIGERYSIQTLFYTGAPSKRNAILRSAKSGYDFTFIITTYEMLQSIRTILQPGEGKTKTPRIDFLVCDEAHTLKNRKTARFDQVASLSKGAKYFIPATGSPIKNGAEDLWSLLYLCDPKRFNSYWQFIYHYMNVVDTPFGKQIIGVRRTDELRALLKVYMARHTKGEVLKELPPKIRQAIPIELGARHRSLYQQIEDDLWAEDSEGNRLLVATDLALSTRLRQMAISPMLVGLNELGEIIPGCIELIKTELESTARLIVFSPFTGALDLLQEYLRKAIPLTSDVEFLNIRGGMKHQDVTDALYVFQNVDIFAQNIILFGSVRSSQSWTAHAASTCICLGSDWVPDVQSQAEDRLHRMGQLSTVRCLYIQGANTIDQHVIDVLNGKQVWQNIILQPREGEKE